MVLSSAVLKESPGRLSACAPLSPRRSRDTAPYSMTGAPHPAPEAVSQRNLPCFQLVIRAEAGAVCSVPRGRWRNPHRFRIQRLAKSMKQRSSGTFEALSLPVSPGGQALPRGRPDRLSSGNDPSERRARPAFQNGGKPTLSRSSFAFACRSSGTARQVQSVNGFPAFVVVIVASSRTNRP